jgi:hypothetical protein
MSATLELPFLPRKWISHEGMHWLTEQSRHLETPLQHQVLFEIACCFNKAGEAYPSIGRIAVEVKKTARSVSRVLSRLRELGVLRILPNMSRVRTNIYRAVGWLTGQSSRGDHDSRVVGTTTQVSSKETSEEIIEERRREPTFSQTINHPLNQRERATQEKNRKVPARDDDRASPPAPPLSPDFWDGGPTIEPDVIPELPADFTWAPPSEPFPGDLEDHEPCDPSPERDQPTRRPDPPRNTRPAPDPVERQAKAKRASLDPQTMIDIWNTAVEGTPLAKVRELSSWRARMLRQMAQSPLRQSRKAWQAVCAYIAGSPFHRGERREDAYPTKFDQVLRANWVLEILEEMQAKAEAYDAELKAQGISKPADDVVWERPRRPPAEPKLGADDLPVLTRKEILAIEPDLAREMGPESSVPEVEARLCQQMVMILHASGALGTKPYIDVRH